jgi:hypothetical protein
VKRLIVIAFFFEIGVALLIVPWSPFWDRNYFAEALPSLHTVITNNFVRGGVSGLGLVNIAAGLAEIVSIMLARSIDPEPTPLRGLRGQD